MGAIRRLRGLPAFVVRGATAPARWALSRARSEKSGVDSVSLRHVDPETPRMKPVNRGLRSDCIENYLNSRKQMTGDRLLTKLATFDNGVLMDDDRKARYNDKNSDKEALFNDIVSKAAEKYSVSENFYEHFIEDIEQHISSN